MRLSRFSSTTKIGSATNGIQEYASTRPIANLEWKSHSTGWPGLRPSSTRMELIVPSDESITVHAYTRSR